jgi:hypothetical protein
MEIPGIMPPQASLRLPYRGPSYTTIAVQIGALLGQQHFSEEFYSGVAEGAIENFGAFDFSTRGLESTLGVLTRLGRFYAVGIPAAQIVGI